MKTPIRSFTVAVAGLDLLHMTRLKLACSLLLSERMDVTVTSWPCTGADLLVTGPAHEACGTTLADPSADAIRTLRISRHAARPGQGVLPHGATVRDFNAQLRKLLSDSEPAAALAASDTTSPTPVLLQLTAADREPSEGLHLLQRGALWLLVDPARHTIALPASTRLVDVCQQLDGQSWSTSEVSEADFLHQYAYRLPQRQSFEALYFAVGHHRPELLAEPPASLRLRHWPDVDATDLPTSWLQPIALLHAAAWTQDALAQHCQVPRATIASLFAAASCSGLALAQERSVPVTVPHLDTADNRFMARLARRFGLGLLRRSVT